MRAAATAAAVALLAAPLLANPICANDADWRGDYSHDLKCVGLTMAQCQEILFQWEMKDEKDDGECHVNTAWMNGVHDMDAWYDTCEGAGGDPQVEPACQDVYNAYLKASVDAHGGAIDSAYCQATVDLGVGESNTGGYWTNYVAAAMGCCGNGATKCDDASAVHPVCEHAASFKPDVQMEVLCIFPNGECPTDEWKDEDGVNYCKVEYGGGSSSAAVMCSNMGGTPRRATTCQMTMFHLGMIPAQMGGTPEGPLDQACVNDEVHGMKRGTFMNMWMGDKCCSDGKSVCAPYMPPPTQVCASPALWRHDHVYNAECDGVNQTVCESDATNGKWDERDDGSVCEFSRFDFPADGALEGACTGAGGMVVKQNTCGLARLLYTEMMDLIPSTIDAAFCNAEQERFGNIDGKMLLGYFFVASGCCGDEGMAAGPGGPYSACYATPAPDTPAPPTPAPDGDDGAIVDLNMTTSPAGTASAGAGVAAAAAALSLLYAQ